MPYLQAQTEFQTGLPGVRKAPEVDLSRLKQAGLFKPNETPKNL
jgi:hypothetical protein